MCWICLTAGFILPLLLFFLIYFMSTYTVKLSPENFNEFNPVKMTAQVFRRGVLTGYVMVASQSFDGMTKERFKKRNLTIECDETGQFVIKSGNYAQGRARRENIIEVSKAIVRAYVPTPGSNALTKTLTQSRPQIRVLEDNTEKIRQDFKSLAISLNCWKYKKCDEGVNCEEGVNISVFQDSDLSTGGLQLLTDGDVTRQKGLVFGYEQVRASVQLVSLNLKGDPKDHSARFLVTKYGTPNRP